MEAPLGTWIIASGISIFGDNPVGWRIMSVLFGVASIFIFYLLCRHLVNMESGNQTEMQSPNGIPPQASWFTIKTFIPLFATFLFAFENLSFIQSSIALLDVFYVTFMLAGFLFYLKGEYWWAGLAMGLSLLCKDTAFLAIIAILIHWAFTNYHQILAEIKGFFYKHKLDIFSRQSRGIPAITKLLFTIVVVWCALIVVLDYPVMHQFVNPISRTVEMLKWHINYSTTSNFNPIVTSPWSWIISPTNITIWPENLRFASGRFILDINPTNPLYFLSISWNIYLLIIISMLYPVYELIRYRKISHSISAFVIAWFLGVYILLIPLELVTDRLMFTYYFYPAVPAVCLAIAWSAWKVWQVWSPERKRKTIFLCLLTGYSVATVVIFFFMSPFGGHFLYGS
jgi:dolichyl-phosphate-mannose-protein mannosyltransferase